MQRDEVIDRLREHEAELKKLGVVRLFLFGSTARDYANENSDVDLFFDYQKGSLGLLALMELKERAAAILGQPTDIMTHDSIHPIFRARIEQSAVLVF